MARVFITGSSQGLGLIAGRLLAEQGNEVVLHARGEARAAEARQALPAAAAVLVADNDLQWRRRPWHGARACSETKFQDALLAACAAARARPGTLSNVMEPGWVPTRMGGPRATGDLAAAASGVDLA